VLAPALPDQPHVARVRHDHLMPHLAQHPAHPGGMRPRLQRDPAARHFAEHLAQGFRRGAHLAFPLHLAPFIQHAVPTRAIAQVQADRQLKLCKMSALVYRYSANLLHSRSPLSVVLSSTSITWERTASRRETGLLIPSVHANHLCPWTWITSELPVGVRRKR